MILRLNGYIWVNKHVQDNDHGEEGSDAEAVYSNQNDVRKVLPYSVAIVSIHFPSRISTSQCVLPLRVLSIPSVLKTNALHETWGSSQWLPCGTNRPRGVSWFARLEALKRNFIVERYYTCWQNYPISGGGQRRPRFCQKVWRLGETPCVLTHEYAQCTSLSRRLAHPTARACTYARPPRTVTTPCSP